MENKDVSGKAKLEEAIGIFEMDDYESLPETDGPLEYSDQHQRKMERILKKYSQKRFVLGKRTAAILLAAVLLCFGVVGISAAKYPSPLAWLEKIYSRFTEFFFWMVSDGRII